MPSGPINGQWHPADPEVKIVWDPLVGDWRVDMELPAGLHGDALEIKASVEGGYVGIPDQMTLVRRSRHRLSGHR